jgi:hypothetical protein
LSLVVYTLGLLVLRTHSLEALAKLFRNRSCGGRSGSTSRLAGC